MKITTQLKLQASHSICFIPCYISCIFRVYTTFHVIYISGVRYISCYISCIFWVYTLCSLTTHRIHVRARRCVQSKHNILLCEQSVLHVCQREVWMRSPLSCDYMYLKTWWASHILRQNHKVHNIDFTPVYTHTRSEMGLSNIISFTFSC